MASSPVPETPDPAPTADLESLRQAIDAVDRDLVEVLSRRARIVVEIGRAKQTTGVPIYAPHREKEVIARAVAANPGPLGDRTIEAIYRELMSGSFALELPLRVGHLGPAGSFSHLAAVRHFGSSVECAPLGTIADVFAEIMAGRCNYGLVPYENSIGGSVADTLDAFQDHGVTIYAEALIEVSQTLLGNCPPGEIATIYSKPEIFDQCRDWLRTRFPEAVLVPMSSSAAAVQRAATEPASAAIGSELAGSIYGVNPLFTSIQDKPENITRFLVIGREAAEPTGDDKTTIMFVTADKPGALVEVLNVFRDASINLTHIEKRPSGRTNWEYTFFVDAVGHRREAGMERALGDVRHHCLSMTVLGSYPRAGRIL